MAAMVLHYSLFLLLVFFGFVGVVIIYGRYAQKGEGVLIGARRRASFLILSIIIIGSLFYLIGGVPGLPDSPKNYQMSDASGSAREQLATLLARLEDNPQDTNAALGIARLLANQGDYQTAEKIYRTLLQQFDGESDEPRGLYIHIKLLLGENIMLAAGGVITAEAASLFREVNDEAPDNLWGQYYLNLLLLQQGQTQLAQENFHEMYQNLPKDSPLRSIVSEQLGQSGSVVIEDNGQNNQETDADAEQAMIKQMVASLAEKQRQDPDNLEGWNMLARSYEVLQQYDKQIAALRHLIRLEPTEEQHRLFLARALRAHNQGEDTEESLMILEEMLAKSPDNKEALWFLARHDWKRGNHDQAHEKLNRLRQFFTKGSDERKKLEKQIEDMLK